METARLAALTPPGSMERVLSELRGRVYRRWGAVSALALPSLVPLGGWPLSLPRAAAAALLAGVAAPLDLRLDRYELHRGYLYLLLACPGLSVLGRRLSAAVEAAAGAEAAVAAAGATRGWPPFEPAVGVLVAGPDLEVDAAEVERAVGIPEERRFGSYGLSVYRLTTSAGRDRWWEQVAWEEEAHVPVKRSGRAAPGSAARSLDR